MFVGDVATTDDNRDSIAVLTDGRVDVIGQSAGLAGDDNEEDEDRGTLITSGKLRFGVEGTIEAGSRVRCTGYLPREGGEGGAEREGKGGERAPDRITDHHDGPGW